MRDDLNLRDFVFDISSIKHEQFHTSNNEITKRFFFSKLLKRGKTNISITNSLIHLQTMIDKRVATGIPYHWTDFGDNRKQNDQSVRIALLAVGNVLLNRHTLNLVELTYFFVKSRLNFLLPLQLQFTAVSSEIYFRSTCFELLNKLIEATHLFKCDDNEFISINCPANNLLLKSLMNSAENFCYSYFNFVIIPVPSQTGNKIVYSIY